MGNNPFIAIAKEQNSKPNNPFLSIAKEQKVKPDNPFLSIPKKEQEKPNNPFLEIAEKNKPSNNQDIISKLVSDVSKFGKEPAKAALANLIKLGDMKALREFGDKWQSDAEFVTKYVEDTAREKAGIKKLAPAKTPTEAATREIRDVIGMTYSPSSVFRKGFIPAIETLQPSPLNIGLTGLAPSIGVVGKAMAEPAIKYVGKPLLDKASLLLEKTNILKKLDELVNAGIHKSGSESVDILKRSDELKRQLDWIDSKLKGRSDAVAQAEAAKPKNIEELMKKRYPNAQERPAYVSPGEATARLESVVPQTKAEEVIERANVPEPMEKNVANKPFDSSIDKTAGTAKQTEILRFIKPDRKLLMDFLLDGGSQKFRALVDDATRYGLSDDYLKKEFNRLLDDYKGTKISNATPAPSAQDAIGIPTKYNADEAIKQTVGVGSVPPTAGSIPEVPAGTGNLRVRKLAGRMLADKNVSEETKQAIRKDPDNYLYRVRNLKDVEQMADDLVKNDLVKAHEVAKTNSDLGGATSVKLIDYYRLQGENDTANDILIDAIIQGTEKGRAVSALKLFSRLDATGAMKLIERRLGEVSAKKASKITQAQKDVIINRMTEIGKMADGNGKNIALHKLFTDIKRLVPDPILSQAASIWKANLLTLPTTHLLNIGANTGLTMADMASKMLASGIDTGYSLLTKAPRTTGMPSPIQYLKGFKEGWNHLKTYIDTGYDPRMGMPRPDQRSVSFGQSMLGKMAQGYVDTIYRALGAGDLPFFYGARTSSIAEQANVAWMNAKRLGKDNPLKGISKSDYIKQQLKNPDTEIARNAEKDALRATFQNKNIMGEAGIQLKKVLRDNLGGLGEAIGEGVMPFVQTPSAYLSRNIDYSPYGLPKVFLKKAFSKKAVITRRDINLALANATVGSAGMLIGSALYNKGMIVLGYPRGKQKEISQAQIEGKGFGNVYIKYGNSWRALSVLGPLGQSILVGAYIQKKMNDEGSIAAGEGKVLTDFQKIGIIGTEMGVSELKTLADAPMIQGGDLVIEAVKDPFKNLPKVAGNYARSVIPAWVSGVARASDKYARETRDEDWLGSIQYGFLNAIPYVREQLPIKVDVFGMPILNDRTALETFVDPTKPMRERYKGDSVVAELRRLIASNNIATPTPISQKFNLINNDKTEFDVKLTPRERADLQTKIGRSTKYVYDKVVNNEQIGLKSGMFKWSNLPDAIRAKVLSGIYSDITSAEQAKYVIKNIDRLYPDMSEIDKKKMILRIKMKIYSDVGKTMQFISESDGRYIFNPTSIAPNAGDAVFEKGSSWTGTTTKRR